MEPNSSHIKYYLTSILNSYYSEYYGRWTQKGYYIIRLSISPGNIDIPFYYTDSLDYEDEMKYTTQVILDDLIYERWPQHDRILLYSSWSPKEKASVEYIYEKPLKYKRNEKLKEILE